MWLRWTRCKDGNMTSYFGFSPRPIVRMDLVNCNRVFSKFEFIFSNPRWIQSGFRYCHAPSPPPRLYLKIIFIIILFYTIIYIIIIIRIFDVLQIVHSFILHL